MLEFVTEGLVLDKESRKESDIVVTIYTKKLGLIFGNAASARKIASKLGPHLEPLNLVRLRLVKKKRFQNIFQIIFDHDFWISELIIL